MSEPSAGPHQGNPRDEVAGIFWVLAGAAIFTVIYAAEKLSGGAVTTLQLLFLRYASGLVILLVALPLSGRPLGEFRSTMPSRQFVRTVFGVVGSAAATQAPVYVPFIDATAVGLMEGMLLVLMGVIFLGERMAPIHWLGAAVALCGAVTVVLGQGAFVTAHDFQAWLGIALAFGSALFFAIEGVMTRILALKERPMTLVLYANAFGTLLTAGPALAAWTPIGLEALVPYLLLGPISVLGQYCYMRGYALAPASLVGPIDYSWLIFAAILGLVVFAQVPTLLSVAGAAVLILGGILLAQRPRS